MTTSTSTSLWIVTAEFTDRDDAVALIDLARELGIVAQLSARAINEKNGASPMRETRLGKLILGGMTPGRSYDLEHFMALCQERGYAKSSASAILSKLVEQGDVERLMAGVYKLASRPGTVIEFKACESCPDVGSCMIYGQCRGL